MGGTWAADLTFLDGDLWVLVFGDETVDHRMEVVRVDLETGDVLARVPLDSSWAHSFVAADGRLVVLEGRRLRERRRARGRVINPSTNPSRWLSSPEVLHADARRVARTGLDLGDQVSSPRPDSGKIPGTRRPGAAEGLGPLRLPRGGHLGIWWLSSRRYGSDRQLNLFDPSTRR